MVGPLIEAHVLRKAKKTGRPLPDNWKHLIDREIAAYRPDGIKILFLWMWDCGGHVPNASATVPGLILLNAEWAAAIALYGDDRMMHDAFKLTIGHELTHQEGDYFFLEPFSKQGRFVYWVNEVHADFGGILRAFDGDAAQGAEAMQFKKNCVGQNDKDAYIHPAWERRMDFIKRYDFGEELIYVIADLTGCHNRELVDCICKHYKGIKLHGFIR